MDSMGNVFRMLCQVRRSAVGASGDFLTSTSTSISTPAFVGAASKRPQPDGRKRGEAPLVRFRKFEVEVEIEVELE
jgi:hypothetical protein